MYCDVLRRDKQYLKRSNMHVLKVKHGEVHRNTLVTVVKGSQRCRSRYSLRNTPPATVLTSMSSWLDSWSADRAVHAYEAATTAPEKAMMQARKRTPGRGGKVRK